MRTPATTPGAAIVLLLLLVSPGLVSQIAAESTDPSSVRRSSWFVATEVTYLGVEADTGGEATLTMDDADTAGTDLSLVGASGLDESTSAPRLVAGWQYAERWGVAVRLFQLTDSSETIPAAPPGVTNLPNFLTLSETGTIDLYTVDLEATGSFTPGHFKIDAMLGWRWASFETAGALEAFGVFTPGNFLQLQLSNGCTFRGDGATAAVAVGYRFGDSPVSVFVGARRAELDGESDSFGRVVGTLAVSPNPPLVGAATVRRNDEDESDLTISEYQVGVLLDFRPRESRIRTYLRAAYEIHDWEIDGPPTGGAGFGGTLADIQVNSFTSAGLGGVEMDGPSLAVGIVF